VESLGTRWKSVIAYTVTRQALSSPETKGGSHSANNVQDSNQ
jgi:hypothetical protein